METRIPGYFEILDGIGGDRVRQKLEYCQELLKRSRTPLVFFERNEVLHSLELFRRHLPEVKTFYAVKANSDPFITQTLFENGSCFDVASGGEIEIMARRGVPGDRMILAHPIKSLSTIQSAIRHQVKAYTFDNVDELIKLHGYFDKLKADYRPASILRIETQSEGVQVNLSEKFGAPPSDALQLLARAKMLNLNPIGISFHVGCQSFDLSNYRRAIEDVLAIFKQAREELNLDLHLVDIGGGFPIDTLLGKGTLGLESYFADLREILAPLKGYTVIAEPGRVIAGPVCSIVTSVVGKSKRNGKNWLYLDDGVYGCYSGIIFDHATFSYLPVHPKYLEDSYRGQLVPYVLAGPTCDSIDIVAREVYLPEDLEMGDKLITTDIGAYSIASSTEFNGFSARRLFYYDEEGKLDQRCLNDRRQALAL